MLYEVITKRGKKELYLKDEAALQEYLLDEGVEGMSVHLEQSGKVLRGKQIIPTLRNILDYNEHFSKMVVKGVRITSYNVCYTKLLRERLALMAYNAGPNRIATYLRDGGVPERFHGYPQRSYNFV